MMQDDNVIKKKET